jgi:CDP-diacylglycerol--glycerol-3-phosphate 3-phosphatidyltransferase
MHYRRPVPKSNNPVNAKKTELKVASPSAIQEPSEDSSETEGGGAVAERHYGYGPTAIVTVANVITFTRAALLPLLFYLMAQPAPIAAWAAFGLWVALAISDTVDGIVARRLGPTTSGAYLDPLADKLQVVGALGMLAMKGRLSWVPLALIVVREAAVSLLRSIAARRGHSIPATPFGKAKTVTQMLAVGMFLFPPLFSLVGPATVALWIAVGFTLASGLDYIWRGWRILWGPKADSPPPDSGSLEGALEPVIAALAEKSRLVEASASGSENGDSKEGRGSHRA